MPKKVKKNTRSLRTHRPYTPSFAADETDSCAAPAWTVEESDELEKWINQLGNKWEDISEKLNRTPSSCRNRWQRIMKGRKYIEQGVFKQRCSRCGAPRRGHVCGVLKPLSGNETHIPPPPPSPICDTRPSSPPPHEPPAPPPSVAPASPLLQGGVGSWEHELEFKLAVMAKVSLPFFDLQVEP